MMSFSSAISECWVRRKVCLCDLNLTFQKRMRSLSAATALLPVPRQHTSHVRDSTAESWDRRSIFLSGRSRQKSYANLTSVEVYVSVSSTLKHQRCRNPCFWKFVSLHPICKIEVHLRPECFLAIREYASYYRLPLWRTVVGQYIELETLPYLNFRLHLNSLYVLSF